MKKKFIKIFTVAGMSALILPGCSLIPSFDPGETVPVGTTVQTVSAKQEKKEISSDKESTGMEKEKVEKEKKEKEEKEKKEKEEKEEKEFYISEITDDIFARIDGLSYKKDCTLPVKDLRYLHILHVDKDGKKHEGEMICNKHIAEDVLEIFRELYKQSYPIEKVRLVDEYNADDEESMADNNSSAFNFRFISHTHIVSKHGLGLAVDINPRYNPYEKKVKGKLSIEPANGADYVDRDKDFLYKIDENDPAYKLFTEHGFEWGGAWKKSKDYQHFELSDEETRRLYPDN